MTNPLVTTAWAPGVFGLSISCVLYGASLAQSLHYVYFFPRDPSLIKSLVLLVFVAEALHIFGITHFYWKMLVICHGSDSWTCETELTWGVYIAVLMNYVITFVVQSFYCHRIWIITDRRMGITLAATLFAIAPFVLGIWASVNTIRDGTIKYLYTTPLVPLAAGVSTVCDIIITSTVFKYLWRSELRRGNLLRDLVVVFINMGALTCSISVIVGVVFVIQGNRYWIGAPAVILCRCYTNSLLAVLNARRRIREREARRFQYAIEMPTLPTIR